MHIFSSSIIFLYFTLSVSAIPGSYVDFRENVDVCYSSVTLSSVNCISSALFWTYNPKTGNCQKLLTGGCWAGKNLFESEFECLMYCAKEPGPSRPKRATGDSSCRLPPSRGHCRAYFDRFFYNSATKQCEPFIYTGCGSNSNNFLTSKDCYRTCKGV